LWWAHPCRSFVIMSVTFPLVPVVPPSSVLCSDAMLVFDQLHTFPDGGTWPYTPLHNVRGMREFFKKHNIKTIMSKEGVSKEGTCDDGRSKYFTKAQQNVFVRAEGYKLCATVHTKNQDGGSQALSLYYKTSSPDDEVIAMFDTLKELCAEVFACAPRCASERPYTAAVNVRFPTSGPHCLDDPRPYKIYFDLDARVRFDMFHDMKVVEQHLLSQEGLQALHTSFHTWVNKYLAEPAASDFLVRTAPTVDNVKMFLKVGGHVVVHANLTTRDMHRLYSVMSRDLACFEAFLDVMGCNRGVIMVDSNGDPEDMATPHALFHKVVDRLIALRQTGLLLVPASKVGAAPASIVSRLSAEGTPLPLPLSPEALRREGASREDVKRAARDLLDCSDFYTPGGSRSFLHPDCPEPQVLGVGSGIPAPTGTRACRGRRQVHPSRVLPKQPSAISQVGLDLQPALDALNAESGLSLCMDDLSGPTEMHNNSTEFQLLAFYHVSTNHGLSQPFCFCPAGHHPTQYMSVRFQLRNDFVLEATVYCHPCKGQGCPRKTGFVRVKAFSQAEPDEDVEEPIVGPALVSESMEEGGEEIVIDTEDDLGGCVFTAEREESMESEEEPGPRRTWKMKVNEVPPPPPMPLSMRLSQAHALLKTQMEQELMEDIRLATIVKLREGAARQRCLLAEDPEIIVLRNEMTAVTDVTLKMVCPDCQGENRTYCFEPSQQPGDTELYAHLSCCKGAADAKDKEGREKSKEKGQKAGKGNSKKRKIDPFEPAPTGVNDVLYAFALMKPDNQTRLLTMLMDNPILPLFMSLLRYMYNRPAAVKATQELAHIRRALVTKKCPMFKLLNAKGCWTESAGRAVRGALRHVIALCSEMHERTQKVMKATLDHNTFNRDGHPDANFFWYQAAEAPTVDRGYRNPELGVPYVNELFTNLSSRRDLRVMLNGVEGVLTMDRAFLTWEFTPLRAVDRELYVLAVGDTDEAVWHYEPRVINAVLDPDTGDVAQREADRSYLEMLCDMCPYVDGKVVGEAVYTRPPGSSMVEAIRPLVPPRPEDSKLFRGALDKTSMTYFGYAQLMTLIEMIGCVVVFCERKMRLWFLAGLQNSGKTILAINILSILFEHIINVELTHLLRASDPNTFNETRKLVSNLRAVFINECSPTGLEGSNALKKLVDSEVNEEMAAVKYKEPMLVGSCGILLAMTNEQMDQGKPNELLQRDGEGAVVMNSRVLRIPFRRSFETSAGDTRVPCTDREEGYEECLQFPKDQTYVKKFGKDPALLSAGFRLAMDSLHAFYFDFEKQERVGLEAAPFKDAYAYAEDVDKIGLHLKKADDAKADYKKFREQFEITMDREEEVRLNEVYRHMANMGCQRLSDQQHSWLVAKMKNMQSFGLLGLFWRVETNLHYNTGSQHDTQGAVFTGMRRTKSAKHT
jgi:hypothetical protein